MRRGLATPEQAKKGPYSNVITRAVGIQQNVRADTLLFDVLPGDTLLLCSDGLSKYVESVDELGGVMDGADYKMYIGIGITLYGIAYFFVHEVVIHQRLKFFTRTKNRYLLALRRAHKAHHKHLGKEDGECFGMLLVPRKYFQKTNPKSLFES